MAKPIVLGLFLLTLAGCAAQQPLLKATQSGKAETTIPYSTIDEVRNGLIMSCTQNGAQVDSDTNSVTCSKREEGGAGLFAQAMIGNPYTDPPMSRVKFTFAQVGQDVFVVADPWLEVQQSFGRVSRVPLTNNNIRNDLQRNLDGSAQRALARYQASHPTLASPPPDLAGPQP